MKFEQDPRFTFETFIVGAGSRMAAAAARRAAQSPGTSYNPLFIYGGRGVGKTHLLCAVGALARTVRPDIRVVFESAEGLVDGLTKAIGGGTVEEFREHYVNAELILLDDVQELAGKTRTQDEVLRLLKEIDLSTTQVVVAADRLASEIPDLTAELRSRFTGGLTVDIAPPEREVRLAVVSQAADARGARLEPGVAEAIAELSSLDLQEVQERVGQVASLQEDEDRRVYAREVATLLGGGETSATGDEFSAFLTDISFTVEQLVEAAPWRRTLAEAILRWEGEGVRTHRLEEALQTDSAPDVAALVEIFTADVARLATIRTELAELDAEAAASPLLRDPDRLTEAEALLRTAQERKVAPPVVPAGPPIDRWYFANPEKVLWSWVALEDRLAEDLG